MSVSAFLSDLECIDVDENLVRAFTSEHLDLAFNLFRETAQYVCVLSNVTVGDKPTWNIRQAVLGGHLVRMFKLMRFLIEELIHNRVELAWIVTRLLVENTINLRYLIEKGGVDTINSYLHQSLQHERELLEQINTNVAARGGPRLAIEDRMIRSITRTFKNSQVQLTDLPQKRIRDWGNKNLFEKAQSVGLDDAYLAIFRGPSRNVHGGWQDMLQHHLHCKAPGEFEPRLDFTAPRPQVIYVLAFVIGPTLERYSQTLGHPDLSELGPRLRNLNERVQLADKLHEEYLSKRTA